MVVAKYDELLARLYSDPASPVCFTTLEPLYREARRHSPGIRRSSVVAFLRRNATYTLHRRARRNFTHLPTLAAGLHTDWQADLCILASLAKKGNKGYRYLLVCIDVLSRQIYVAPVKSKGSDDMVGAFREVFRRSKYIPWRLMTDQGKEFTAKTVREYLRRHDIRLIHLHTTPEVKCGMAERANRTIKDRLYRYFTDARTFKWIDVIQLLVTAINNSYNSSIRMRPADVNFSNAHELRERLQAERIQPPRLPSWRRLKVGDRVRIAKYKQVFEKGYLPNFTEEVFTVAEVLAGRHPVTYRLIDGKGERFKGVFYQEELCPVTLDRNSTWEIRRVLETRSYKGAKYCLVEWKDRPHTSAWIPASELAYK